MSFTLGKDIQPPIEFDARGWTIDPNGPYVQVDGKWYRAGSEPKSSKP